jgi:hypothetical protein
MTRARQEVNLTVRNRRRFVARNVVAWAGSSGTGVQRGGPCGGSWRIITNLASARIVMDLPAGAAAPTVPERANFWPVHQLTSVHVGDLSSRHVSAVVAGVSGIGWA